MHWHALWFGYFVPSLWGNGPEELISLAVFAVLGSLIWPPSRRVIERFVQRHLKSEHEELHAKLDHIIHFHPDIPAYNKEQNMHGLRGYKRHVAPDPKVAATAPSATDFGAPPESDFTFGRAVYGMQGNAEWGNCWFAALIHCRTITAIVSFVNGATTFVAGFKEDDSDAGVRLYNRYQVSQGQKPVAPGEGTDPYTGITFALNEGLIYAGGVLGPPDRQTDGTAYFAPATVGEAVYDFQGGVIACWALDPDAEQEFDDHQSWGTQSSTPDDQDGHATSIAKYQPGNPIQTVITWAALEGVLELMSENCMEGLCLVITEGFILKNGQAAADALVAKWQLQVSTTFKKPVVAVTEADDTVLVSAEGDITRLMEDVQHDADVVQHHLKRLEEAVAQGVTVAVLESIAKDLLKSYTHGAI
jgi:hypothetical protein